MPLYSDFSFSLHFPLALPKKGYLDICEIHYILPTWLHLRRKKLLIISSNWEVVTIWKWCDGSAVVLYC